MGAVARESSVVEELEGVGVRVSEVADDASSEGDREKPPSPKQAKATVVSPVWTYMRMHVCVLW